MNSIQPVSAACAMEQLSIMYLNDSFISRYDIERVPQNLYYGDWDQPVNFQ